MYSSARGYWEANVVAPRLALDAAVAGGASASCTSRRSSSTASTSTGEVDERTPVRPNGVHYVDTKIASERVVLAAHAEGEIDVHDRPPG